MAAALPATPFTFSPLTVIPFTFSPLLAVREDFGESLDVETREGLTVSLEEDVVPFEYACTLEEEVLFSCPSGVL